MARETMQAQATIDTAAKPLSATPMQTEETAVERYTYQASAPVKTVGTLKALLQGQESALRALLPAHVTPERLLRTLLTTVNRTPKLLECTQSSIVEAVMRAGELGLDVSGTLQEAWILPFTNKVGGQFVTQATLIPGYRGLAKLARQSGEVLRIEAQAVKEHDHFEIEHGSTQKLVFRPKLDGDRGATIGAYALIALRSGEVLTHWMSREDVEKVRRKSKQPDSLMWREHWDEGARKTVFRNLAKWAPLSAEKAQQFHAAIEQADSEFDLERLADAIDVSAPKLRTAELLAAAAGDEDGPTAADRNDHANEQPAEREPGED